MCLNFIVWYFDDDSIVFITNLIFYDMSGKYKTMTKLTFHEFFIIIFAWFLIFSNNPCALLVLSCADLPMLRSEMDVKVEHDSTRFPQKDTLPLCQSTVIRWVTHFTLQSLKKGNVTFQQPATDTYVYIYFRIFSIYCSIIYLYGCTQYKIY